MKINEQEWLKLLDIAKLAAANCRRNLPSDWYITVEEITSAALGEVVHLMERYEDGAASLTTYVWSLLEKHLMRDLMREYKSLKKQLDVTELDMDSDDS